jgi:hypothetical protein
MSAEPSPITQATSVSLTSKLAHPVPIAGATQANLLHGENHTKDPMLSSSVPLRNDSLSATSLIRRALAESTSKTSRKKARSAPFKSFINTVTAPDGSSVQVTKKPRKVRSDKGKKRGSRSKENDGASSSGAAGK